MVVLDNFALKLYPGSFDFYGTEKHEKFGTIMVLVSTIISCLIYFIKVSAMIFLKIKYFALFISRFNETTPPPPHTHTNINHKFWDTNNVYGCIDPFSETITI